MRKYLSILAGLLFAGVVLAQKGANNMNNQASKFSVDETMGRIEQILQKMDIPVFAKFDHQKNAKEVGLDLRPNQVIVFGSPKVGTKLMQENPAISIELPLKISVWEDKNGKVWTSFPQMEHLASEYGLEKEPVIGKMQELLENAGTTERDGRNDAKRLCTNVVTVSDEVKPKKRKMQGKAEYSRRTVCKSLPKKM